MNVVQVFSPKGGVGVTTVVAALASSFARLDISVTVLDLSGQDSLKLHFGLQSDHTLPSALDGHAPLEAVGGVRLLAGNTTARSPSETEALYERALEGSDIVFVDLGTHRASDVSAMAPEVLATVVVLGTDPASVGVLPRLVAMDLPHYCVLVNQFDPRTRLSQDADALVKHALGERVLGTIRRDQAVPEALAMGEVLLSYAPKSGASADFEAVTQTLLAHMASKAPSVASHADAA